MAKISFQIEGIEKAELLIKKHYDLLDELAKNLYEIRKEYLDLEVKLNQPPAATDD